jgi:hypothetical protein
MLIEIHRHELVFTGASTAEYLERQRLRHPLAVVGFEVLERAGHAEAAKDQLRQILEDGNEDKNAFRSTSRYVVVSASRRRT